MRWVGTRRGSCVCASLTVESGPRMGRRTVLEEEPAAAYCTVAYALRGRVELPGYCRSIWRISLDKKKTEHTDLLAQIRAATSRVSQRGLAIVIKLTRRAKPNAR